MDTCVQKIASRGRIQRRAESLRIDFEKYANFQNWPEICPAHIFGPPRRFARRLIPPQVFICKLLLNVNIRQITKTGFEPAEVKRSLVEFQARFQSKMIAGCKLLLNFIDLIALSNLYIYAWNIYLSGCLRL